MEFYSDKFKAKRKDRRYTSSEFCKLMSISRSTLWEWETQRRKPSESNVRHIANLLKIGVEEISSLRKDPTTTGADFSAPRDAVKSLFNTEPLQRKLKFDKLIYEITNLKEELDQAAVIINTLLTTMYTMFYIKDANLKYVIANSNFLLNVSLPEDFISKGHDDVTFFSKRDAKWNSEMDLEVLKSKKPIINREDFIPGTRKKKWGLITKVPIMDSTGNSVGVLGTFLDITDKKAETEQVLRDKIEHEIKRKLMESLEQSGVSKQIIGDMFI